jgi:hypothetical protein
MTSETVVERLGAPTRSTTLQEVLSPDPNVVTIVEPSILRDHALDEYWLYLNVPPGHKTEIVINRGVVTSVRTVRDDRVIPARTPPPSAAPSVSTAILDEIATAAAALPPVTNDVIVKHYNLIELLWGVDGIFPGSMPRVRATLADVVSRSLREGFEISVTTLADPLPYVQVNVIGATWCPCVVVKPTPKDGSGEDHFALYGHGALRIGDAWRRHT